MEKFQICTVTDCSRKTLIVLDSGADADISLLPQSMASCGSSSGSGRAVLEDAQGGRLMTYGKKLAQIECEGDQGDGDHRGRLCCCFSSMSFDQLGTTVATRMEADARIWRSRCPSTSSRWCLFSSTTLQEELIGLLRNDQQGLPGAWRAVWRRNLEVLG